MKALFLKTLNTCLLITVSASLLGQTILPGSLAGQPDVAVSGAFTYSIPLTLPPGVKEVMPHISLNYNSQAGNGPLGMGWSLAGGLSCISRIPSDIYHDLGINPVNFSSADNIALDGEKLVKVGSTSYKKVVEDFSVISSFGTVGSGPAFFEVESQDGIVYEYGSTTDSRMIASGTSEVLIWALSRTRDRNGNNIDYHYSAATSSGTFRLDRITYGGNFAVGSSAKCELTFGYHTRGDVSRRYIYGSVAEQPERLNSIIVKYDGAIIHQYNLGYSEDFYSHLTQVVEIGQDGSILRPTLFTWGGTGVTADVNTSLTSDPSSTPVAVKHLITVGDFNGDGYADILGFKKGSPTVAPDFELYKNLHDDDFITAPVTGTPPIESGQIDGGVKAVLDFNGDGKTDMVTATYSATHYVVYMHIGNGTGFNAPYGIYSNGGDPGKFANVLITAGNFLGNGKQQVLLAFPDTPPVPPVPSSGVIYFTRLIGDDGFVSNDVLTSHRREFQALDFDGDGKDELFTTTYYATPSVTQIYSFATAFDPVTKAPLSGTTSMTNTVFMGYPTKWHSVFYGDFNGDGLKDVLTYMPTFTYPWEIGYSVGNNISKFVVSDPAATGYYLGLQLPDPAASTADNNIRIGDFNGDGKDDILEMYQDGIYFRFKVYYSKGADVFVSETYTPVGLANIEDQFISVGDFNGDGQSDILLHPEGEVIRILYFHKSEQKHLIHQIEKQDNAIPGDGQVITVEYWALTNDILYEHCSFTPAFPFREVISGSLKLVKSLKNNRTSLWNNYGYKGSLGHGTGLGFRGFEMVMTEHVLTNSKTVQVFDQRSYKKVVPTESSQYFSSGGSVVVAPANLAMRKLFTYGQDILPNNIGLIYPVSESAEDYYNNLYSTTSYSYDPAIGSLQSIGKPDIISTNTGYGKEITTQRIVYNTGAPEFYNRDNPSDITVTNMRTGSVAFVQSNSYNYDSRGRILNIKKDVATAHENTISYNYDAWGNVLDVTSSVASTTPVVEQFTYSADHRFLTRTINPAGHVERWTHDAWGNTLTATDINGVTTTKTYDVFNRILSTVNSSTPTITNTLQYHWANSLPECPTGVFALAVQSSISGISGDHIEFYDYNGKTRRSVHNGFNGSRIFNDATYNFDGTIQKQYLPTSTGIISEFTSYLYDNFGRLLSVTDPAAGITNFIYDINGVPAGPFGGMTVTARNTTSGKIKVTTLDESGKTIEIDDCAVGNIKHEYHSNGKVSLTNINRSDLFYYYSYDGYGNLIDQTAPNKNLTIYTYDNRNRLATQTDAAGITFSFQYDILNRITSKSAPGAAFTYIYDGAGISSYGNLTRAVGPVSTSYSNFTYDLYSRLTSTTETVNGTSCTTSNTYDGYGRVATRIYPDGNTIRNEYNSYGYKNGIWALGFGSSSLAPDLPLWRKNAENIFGLTTDVSIGMDPAFSFAITTPTPISISSFPMIYNQTHSYNGHGFLVASSLTTAAATLNSNVYSFNEATGNLLSINDVLGSKSEVFTYDVLDRLTEAAQSGFGVSTANQTFRYADNGNMIKKSDISTHDWKYDKYAVNEIPLPTAAIPSFTQTATYNPFDKVATLNEDNKVVRFSYGPGEQRAMTEYFSGSTLTKTRYYSNAYEKTVDASGFIQEISYVMAEGRPVAMFVKNGSSATELKFVGTDHLGSIVHVLNTFGAPDEDRSYDAWGRMRNPYDWSYTGIPAYTYDRGYTGQEFLPDFKIINLNGRLYDPVIGRMYSVDPYITDPTNSQTYNSYSYCYNNPLKYTDKNGEWAIIDDLTAMAIGGVSNVISQGLSGGIGSFADVGAYFTIGALAGEASLYGGPLAGGAVMGLGNSVWGQATENGKINFNNVDWEKGLGAAAFGAVTSYGSAALGGAIGPVTSKLFNRVASPVLRKGLTSAVDGAATGFVFGTGLSLVNGATMGDALSEGLYGATQSFGMGLMTGGIAGYLYAKKSGINPWTGELVEVRVKKNHYNDLLSEAQKRYPKKAGRTENHHVEPKYLGGAKDGQTVPIDAAYHQLITNEFNSEVRHGKGPVNDIQRKIIMDKVYSKFPLPGYNLTIDKK